MILFRRGQRRGARWVVRSRPWGLSAKDEKAKAEGRYYIDEEEASGGGRKEKREWPKGRRCREDLVMKERDVEEEIRERE